MRVCVYGASSSRLEKIYYDECEKLGSLLAQSGHGIVFGGGREGLMGAIARGSHSLGGEIIGIAPRFFDEPGILYENCTELIFTETMRERKKLMEERSDACLVLPGGIGTFEEFFEMLTLKQLGQSEKAIVILNINGYYEPMQTMLEHAVENGFVSKNCLELYSFADTPEQAISALENYVPRTGDIHKLSDYSK